ncbi:N-6 DNA methylase [Peribacillus sp. V2I11]|uniref:N-6 DNA methylase n=1 Tax=Peribacillus sp. V2I11 TaxID=3042277 RepID=UPI0027845EB1|nr:N-6 DNA methylase [Peribacillus sp. V2I11]MDQ0884887.1 type I restriction enzyme M protein [Peribacillus sp. V2I11]
MSIENTFWKFNDLNRNDLNHSEIRKVNASISALKYLCSKREKFNLPSSCCIEHILRSQNHVNEVLISTLQFIEDHVDFLSGVFEPYDMFRKINSNVLLKFLFELESVQIKDEEWSSITNFLFDFNEDFRTPSSLNNLGIRILNLKSGELYDGALGIGGSHVAANQFAKSEGLDLHLYGQEINKEIWSLAKLNLLINEVDNVEVALGDTLLNPQFIKSDTLKKFDYVYMNYPFGMKLIRHEFLEYDPYNRFVYGPVLKSSGDSAFIQHALTSLNNEGRGVLVVTNGVLFRSTEQTLRRNLLSSDLIEAVIALPENLLGYTAIQTNLLVLNKKKPKERKNKVLFINAVNEFGEERKKRVLTTQNIKKISEVFFKGNEVDKFSKFVNISQIDDANLLCGRYLENDEIITDDFGKVIVNRQQLENLSNLQALGNIAKVYRGINLTPKQIEEGKGSSKIIKLSDVENGIVHAEEIIPSNITIQKSIEDYIVEEGDIIISSRGANIKVAIVPKHTGTLILSQNFLGIRVGKETDAHYLKAFLESPVGQFLITGIQSGTSIKNINAKDLKEIKIPFHTKEEQKRIGEEYQISDYNYLETLKKAKEEKLEILLKVYQDMGINQTMELKRTKL